LQVEDVGGGRNLADRILQQWAHLWVWQGKSGHDPSGDAASEQNALLARLQQEGGAVALQSPRDAEVAGRFAERSAALFTQAGRPKAGSELQQAEARLEAARAARQDAAGRQQRLVDAASAFDEAEETIRRTTADLESLAAGLRKVEEQLAAAQRLKTREEQQALASARAEEKLADLLTAAAQSDTLRREKRARDAALAPGREEAERARDRREERRAQAQLAAKAHGEAAAEARLLRQRCDLARAWVERFDCDARCRRLAGRLEDAQKIRDSIRSLRDDLAPLPRVDADSLGRLRQLQAHADRAAATLEAMAAGIEVVSSGRPVRIGDREAPAGSAHRVTDAVDIFIGEDVHLRVRPGGGNSLAEARDSLRAAGDALREALDPLGVDSVARAAAILNVREGLRSKLEREQSRLGDFDDGSLEGDLAEAREALAAAEGEVDRRSRLVPGTREPLDRDRAAAWRQGEEQALERAEEEETTKKAAGQAAGEAFDAAEQALVQLAAAIGAQEAHLVEIQAQLRLLLTNHGEDASRLEALRAAGRPPRRPMRLSNRLARSWPSCSPSSWSGTAAGSKGLSGPRKSSGRKRANSAPPAVPPSPSTAAKTPWRNWSGPTCASGRPGSTTSPSAGGRKPSGSSAGSSKRSGASWPSGSPGRWRSGYRTTSRGSSAPAPGPWSPSTAASSKASASSGPGRRRPSPSTP
jgi:hypothetical protein